MLSNRFYVDIQWNQDQWPNRHCHFPSPKGQLFHGVDTIMIFENFQEAEIAYLYGIYKYLIFFHRTRSKLRDCNGDMHAL